MSIRTRAAAVLVAVAATAGAAHARTDVQWQVSIPGPIGLVIGNTAPVYAAPAYPAAVYAPPVVYSRPVAVVEQPVVVVPRRGDYRGRPSRWDVDGDGIPNRYDHRYNPRWDRDGDGVPNWRDRHDGWRR